MDLDWATECPTQQDTNRSFRSLEGVQPTKIVIDSLEVTCAQFEIGGTRQPDVGWLSNQPLRVPGGIALQERGVFEGPRAFGNILYRVIGKRGVEHR